MADLIEMDDSTTKDSDGTGTCPVDQPRPICADCGAIEPEWASINRGVLICSECCSVHRNLGRHVSQVRSLTKGAWPASQLALINSLYRSGANNVWEHALIDSAAGGTGGKFKKKPVSNDPIIPKKEAFIKAKYGQLAFAIRPPKDERLTLDELNKQLWCCVRTSHVETTLRLLALGADPNYADSTSGRTSLHVAAAENQILQVELLWLYGADVARRDVDKATPAALAQEQKFFELAERLDALEFDATDRFSTFLCGRAADHSTNQHFIIPELAEPGAIGHQIRPFRRRLQASSGPVLERLIQDVYDEVDRREVSQQWVAAECYRLGNHQYVAVFLPPTPCLSATRNQLRQKLAKFNLHDFSLLLIDLLKEIRRRYYGLLLPPLAIEESTTDGCIRSPLNLGRSIDESRDYDDVADALQRSRISNGTKRSSEPAIQKLTLDGEAQDGWLSDIGARSNGYGAMALDNYLELKERLVETNDKLDSALQTNIQLLGNFSIIQNLVDRLQSDQTSLRCRLDALMRSSMNYQHHHVPPVAITRFMSPAPGAIIMPTSTLLKSTTMTSATRPLDSHFPNRHQRPGASYHHYRQHSLNMPMQVNTMIGGSLSTSGSSQFQNLIHGISTHGPAVVERHESRHASGSGVRSPPLASSTLTRAVDDEPAHDKPDARRKHCAPMERIVHEQKYTATYHQSKTATLSSSASNASRLKGLFNDEVFPDNLILETELLTGAIKNLLADLQGQGDVKTSSDANTVFHADSIDHHIARIVHHIVPAAFPRGGSDGDAAAVHRCVADLETAMAGLSRKCHGRSLDTDETVQAAYDLAKAAKQLLLTVHQVDKRQFS